MQLDSASRGSTTPPPLTMLRDGYKRLTASWLQGHQPNVQGADIEPGFLPVGCGRTVGLAGGRGGRPADDNYDRGGSGMGSGLKPRSKEEDQECLWERVQP